jgi:ElaB/YqjD/DUF883 family membrane-anchored ribosome-binding protein
MRCRDVKRRLNDAILPDAEMLEHLESCPSCAREVQAGRILAHSLESARESADFEDTAFDELKARLETLSSRQNSKGNKIMDRVKNQISDHPGFSFGIVAAICLFAFVVLVPISYNKTVGYDLVLTGVNAQNGFEVDTARDVVEAIGYTDVQISTSLDDRKLKIIFEDLPSKEAVREITSAMTSLAKIDLLAEVSPVVVNQMGSIYAQVKDKIEEIRIETGGKTNQEIKEEIERKLRESGHGNPRVNVTTNADGEREITIDTDFKQQTDKGEFEGKEKRIFLVGEGESVNIEGSPHKRLKIDTEGKTNAEIEAEIREKLLEQGMDNPDISIIETPDGRRQIKIEAEKEKKED